MAGGRHGARGRASCARRASRGAGAGHGRADACRAARGAGGATPTWWRGASRAGGRRARAGGGRVHVKLDTGMGRLGTKDLERRALSRCRGAERRRRADDPLRHRRRARRRASSRSSSSVHRFVETAARDAPGPVVHAANSAATLREPAAHFDMVRCGVAIYGLDPFQGDPRDRGLEPALTLESWVAAVRRFEPGRAARATGARWRRGARRPRSATVPIGYGDGWRRGALEQLRRADPRAPPPGGGHGEHGQHHRRRSDRTPTWWWATASTLIGARATSGYWPRRWRAGSARSTTRSPAGCSAAGEPAAGEVSARHQGAGRATRLDRGRRPCATSCSAARSPDVDVAVAGDAEAAARALAPRGARPGVPALGALRRLARDRPRVGPHAATCRRSRAPRSRRTSRAATSPSTRWPGRWTAGTVIDPHGGRRGPRARVLRWSRPEAYEADPLRPLRLARFAAELGFAPDADTERLTRAAAPRRVRASPASGCSPSCGG